jgi:hypothetical protein
MTEKLSISVSKFDYVQCLFNPEQYTLSKTNKWNSTTIPGTEVPDLEFLGGESQTLSLKLFFDTSLTGEDVRSKTEKLFEYMKPTVVDKKTNKGRPPVVTCSWGKTRLFKAVLTKIDQTFTLFRDDGTPVRSDITASFQQAEEELNFAPQNPTSAGSPGYKQWLVKEGDTIDSIAFAEYGDSSMWRYLADINGLNNPGKLRLGQVLVIAPPP